MRALLAVLVLLIVAFAGCADKGKDGKGGSDSSTSGTDASSGSGSKSSSGSKSGSGSSSGSSSQSGTGAPGANHAPTATLTATPQAGTLNVGFALNASDPDHDTLTYSLTFGDNSTAQTGTFGAGPANATHTFAAAGTYLVKLNVSDGKAFGLAQANVTLSAGGGSKDPIILTGHINAASPLAMALAFCGGEPGGSVTGVWNVVDVPAEAIGGSYTATPAEAMYEFGDSTNSDADTGPIAPSGTVGPNTDELWVCTDDPSMSNFDWTVTIIPV